MENIVNLDVFYYILLDGARKNLIPELSFDKAKIQASRILRFENPENHPLMIEEQYRMRDESGEKTLKTNFYNLQVKQQ